MSRKSWIIERKNRFRICQNNSRSTRLNLGHLVRRVKGRRGGLGVRLDIHTRWFLGENTYPATAAYPATGCAAAAAALYARAATAVYVAAAAYVACCAVDRGVFNKGEAAAAAAAAWNNNHDPPCKAQASSKTDRGDDDLSEKRG